MRTFLGHPKEGHLLTWLEYVETANQNDQNDHVLTM